MKRLLFGLALAGLVSAPLAAVGKSTQAAIILNAPTGSSVVSAAAADIWVPSLGDSVSFTTVYPSSLDRYAVSIQVLCYQHGNLVFATAGLHNRTFTLGGSGSAWLETGGAATCRADLYYWSTNGQRFNLLASTEFAAQG
jgi:hypothetical protein